MRKTTKLILFLVFLILAILVVLFLWVEKTENILEPVTFGIPNVNIPEKQTNFSSFDSGSLSLDDENKIDFREKGNLVKNNPGMEIGTWYLVYEKPGQSALNKKLIFSAESKCTYEAITKLCYETQMVRGDRVFVAGETEENGINVRTIIIEKRSE